MENSPMYQEEAKREQERRICEEILRGARNELYLQMRFLDVALSGLQFAREAALTFLGTDGQFLFYEPARLFSCYKEGSRLVNRAYLHSLFHCLFAHPFSRGDREEERWNLACDMAVEFVLDELSLSCIRWGRSQMREKLRREWKQELGILTAEKIYRKLESLCPSGEEEEAWRREFLLDDHRYWEQQRKGPSSRQERKKTWEDIGEKLQTEMETFSKEAAKDQEGLTEQLRVQNRKRYDYREFLRKFAVLREEMRVDMDAFDYIYYHYGMEAYGNMPLIEPLETKEMKRIEDFVIVIDTSMSCKGELVQKFLEQTFAVLTEADSFFHRICIHILQCDEKVRADHVITGREELKAYMEQVPLTGGGGTDFRPPFAYVEELQAKGAFTRLRGLLYFTDGYGTFPARKPDYETAFIFMKEDYQDVDVPPWAVKLILEPEELEDKGAELHGY